MKIKHIHSSSVLYVLFTWSKDTVCIYVFPFCPVKSSVGIIIALFLGDRVVVIWVLEILKPPVTLKTISIWLCEGYAAE